MSQDFKLLDGVSPNRFYLLSQGRHLLFKLLFLRAYLYQFLPQLFYLLIKRTHGLLVLPLFVHQSAIMFPNPGDDPLLSNATILKSLDANQGLKKRRAQTLVR